ncbi:Vacuolar protein sorting-associated protein 41 [Umbelopsis sp. WA50703]
MSNPGNPAVPEMHSAQFSAGENQDEEQHRPSSNAHSDDDASAEDDDSEYEDDDDDEEDEEPKLRYNRIKSSVAETLAKDAASVLRVSMRFVAMGTHWGAVHILDFDGNLIKSWQNHSATVNDISIDEAEDFVATASDDGKIYVCALYTPEIQSFNYRRPVKSVAIDPEYKNKSTRQFVSGGMAEQLIMNEKGWLGHKDVVLHANEGPIYSIKWRGNFIAWANDTGVKMYDTATNLRMTYIDRPAGSPRGDLYRCRMCWKDDTTLLIGWANMVKIAKIREKKKGDQVQGQPNHYVEIICMFQTDNIVCGIAPFVDNMVILYYVTEEDSSDEEESADQKPLIASQPELHILDWSGEEISSDVLAVNGYAHYQPNDYGLEFYPTEDMFYILSPKDIVAAYPRDQDDHIQWLLEHRKYEEALQTARQAIENGTPSEKFDVGDIGQQYLMWLMEHERYEDAAAACENILENDQDIWEKWIFKFAEIGELKAMASHIPIQHPQLSSTVYEMVLAWLLQDDHKSLLDTLHEWPPILYNVSSVIVAVEDQVEKDKDNITLLECLADLYTYNGRPDKAIEYNLRLRRPNAFELIREYNMYEAVRDKAVLLMEFDQYLLEEQDKAEPDESTPKKPPTEMPAVQLLIENTQAIPPKKVVQQLKPRPKLLHTYLDALFERDPHLGYEFHDIQIELYADYDYGKLLDFLRASNYYSLERAYNICDKRQLIPEMVFVLSRMGNNKEALMLIIEKLGDVQRAIDFAKEQNDDDLWEDLLKYSMDKPLFIKGLLENVGTDIEPLRLIKRIPNKMEIPDLKQALLKILQDYHLQMSLRQGCEKILVSDSVQLADKMHRTQKRGIQCQVDLTCSICNEPAFEDEDTATIVFFCKHAFHQRCLIEDEGMEANVGQVGDSLASKVNYAALLMSSRTMACPICQEQVAKGNGVVHRIAERLEPTASSRIALA